MDVVALLAMVGLPLAGIVTLPEAFAGFSDPSVVLIGALFVVGDGLVRTGVANRIGEFLLHHSAGSEARLVVLLMLSVAMLGAVMSSTGVVAIFISVVLLVAGRKGIHPGRLMMPLSFAGLISGMLTLVGTAPNLVANAALEHAGFPGFGFFSFTPFGLVVLAAGIVYMLFASRRLGRGREPEHPRRNRRTFHDFVADYQLEQRELRVRVGEDSPLAGRTLGESGPRRNHAANVVSIERPSGGRTEQLEPRATTVLHAGDVLLVDFPKPLHEGNRETLQALGLEPLALRGDFFTDHSRELGMAEVLLPPGSEMVGRSVIESGFRSRHRLNVIGLRRGSGAVESGVAEEKLRSGDVLLVMGRWNEIRKLPRQHRDFVVLTLPQEFDRIVPAESRAPHAIACLAVMITMMVTGWIPNALAALIACLLMGALGCITLNSAYRSIQWPGLLLIAGMMPFSIALQKTGGVDLAVQGLLKISGGAEPRLLIAALFALTAVVGLFVSNTATAVLMAPIAVDLAKALQLSPQPFVMTVALAASAAFMTPVSSPVNTLVLVPGRYRFGDFVRIGVPFTLLVGAITVLLVPWLLPLQP